MMEQSGYVPTTQWGGLLQKLHRGNRSSDRNDDGMLRPLKLYCTHHGVEWPFGFHKVMRGVITIYYEEISHEICSRRTWHERKRDSPYWYLAQNAIALLLLRS